MSGPGSCRTYPRCPARGIGKATGPQIPVSASVVPEMLPVRPDTIAGHVESIRQRATPLGCRRGLTPVVSDANRVAVLQLADGHVSVQAAVTVVARPLGD